MGGSTVQILPKRVQIKYLTIMYSRRPVKQVIFSSIPSDQARAPKTIQSQDFVDTKYLN